MNKYKNRLIFAYYSLRLKDFKSLQNVPKTLQMLKAKNRLFKRYLYIEIPVFMISNLDFLLLIPAPSTVENTFSRPFFSQNLDIPYWKSSFPVNRQIPRTPSPPLILEGFLFSFKLKIIPNYRSRCVFIWLLDSYPIRILSFTESERSNPHLL